MASEYRQFLLGRVPTAPIHDDRIVKLIFALTSELDHARTKTLRCGQVEEVLFAERSLQVLSGGLVGQTKRFSSSQNEATFIAYASRRYSRRSATQSGIFPYLLEKRADL